MKVREGTAHPTLSSLDSAVPDEVTGLGDLTSVLFKARRGFRSDVASMIEALDHTSLLVALSRPLPGVDFGQAVPLDGELSLSPQLIPDPAGELFAALFSRRELLEHVAQQLEWTTSGGALHFCTLPTRIALHVASELIVVGHARGAVINPGDDSELLLSNEELSSIVQGRAIPLVGYVRDIPLEEKETTLISEIDEPLPLAVTQALSECQAKFAFIQSYQLLQQFNRERDLEPHLAITLMLDRSDIDRQAIYRDLVERLEGKLPPPGYVDVLFRNANDERVQGG